MNKTDLINTIAGKASLTKRESEKALTAALEAITASLCKGEKVKIAGFGSFEIKERAERTGKNPRTGEEVTIPASRNVSFKAAKVLKETLSK